MGKKKTVSNQKKNPVRTEHSSSKDYFMDALHIPADISNGTMRLTITGARQVWVENYLGILDYTDNRILLQGRNGTLCIEGKKLKIEYYTRDDMFLRGIIHDIHLYGNSYGREVEGK